MAGYTLPPDHLGAGRDYLAALKKLGLQPEGLLWAYDRTVSEFVLVLVTGQFDFVGPTAIYETLTRAYNLAATPAAISPFILRLHSPRQEIVRELRTAYGWDIRVDPLTPDPPGITVDIELNAGDLTFRVEWVYHLRERKIAPAERARRWRTFQGNVAKLAA